MIATVKHVDQNATFKAKSGKQFDVINLAVYDEAEGKERNWNLFKNMPIARAASGVKAGDRVEITMEEKNGYWNPVGIELAPDSDSGGATNTGTHSNKDTNIARAVALKAAVELYAPTVKAGKHTETALGAIAIAKVFEAYLTGEVIDEATDVVDGGSLDDSPF